MFESLVYNKNKTIFFDGANVCLLLAGFSICCLLSHSAQYALKDIKRCQLCLREKQHSSLHSSLHKYHQSTTHAMRHTTQLSVLPAQIVSSCYTKKV